MVLKSEFEGLTFAPYTVVACMLLLEGADLYLKNKQGTSPFSISPPDISHVLRTVVQKCGYVNTLPPKYGDEIVSIVW